MADDLMAPIRAAFRYKEQLERAAGQEQEQETAYSMTEQAYLEHRRMWLMRASNNKRAQDVLAELMKVNLSFSDMEAERKERLGRWYVWIVSEYINCVSCGTGEFKTAAEGLAAFGNKPEQQEYFELRCTADEVVDPERMNEVTYILRIITGLCKDILNGYRIMAILEPMEKVYVLRVRIQMYKDSFRIKNTTMREGLSRATELAIDALGYKSVVMNKEQETIFNLALRR